jgi:DNA-binding response OmpR family regulator
VTGDEAIRFAARDWSEARRRALYALIATPGRWITTHELVRAIYAHDPEGGPVEALKASRNVVCWLRRRLDPLARIESAKTRGYRLILNEETA